MGAAVGVQAAPGGDVLRHRAHGGDVLPRGGNKSIGIGPLLAIFTMAVAAGAKDLKAAHAFARRLSNAQLKELGCPKAKDALGNEVWGKYVCPSYNAFYHLLRHKDSE